MTTEKKQLHNKHQLFITYFEFSFFHSINSLYTCSYRFRNFAGNNMLAMILSASASNFCMTEFFITEFNETTIKNIISLFLRALQTLNVVKFYFIRYGSSVSTAVNEGRGYHCRCTFTLPSLYDAVFHRRKSKFSRRKYVCSKVSYFFNQSQARK